MLRRMPITQIRELVEEQNRADWLRSYNLELFHRVLLAGPLDDGNTSLAEAIADALNAPFLIVSYGADIGRYLIETEKRIEQIFEYATFKEKCMLLLSVNSTLSDKERGDLHDPKAIKRVK